jgi:hypothetical protein
LLDVLQIAETGQAEDLHAELRQRCDQSLYYFAKVLLGYKDMSDDFHLPLCRDEIEGTWTKKGFLLPRGHFKSTIITKARTLWLLSKDPERRFLFVGESDKVAKKNLNDIKWHIENNRILKWLYPELVPPDFNNTKWSDTEILLPRQGTYDEPTIMSVGVGAKVTGFHFTDIDYDDIFGELAAGSRAEAERVIEWVQYAPGLLVDPETSCEVWVGTRWKHGNGDVYGWVMENMPYVQWYRRAAIEEGKPIFPQRFSMPRLREIESREGTYKFACQYMNDPTPPEGADFSPSLIKYYSVSDDKRTLLPEDGTSSVTLSALTRCSMYDPSTGGKMATAENSIGVGGISADRRIFILDSWAKNCGYEEAIERWHTLKDQFITYQDFYELVGGQKSVEDLVRTRRGELECKLCGAGKGTHLPHKPMRPLPEKPAGGNMHKDDRIRLYAQQAFEQGRVYLRRGMEQLRNQIVTFPHATLVDRFDVVAYLIHILERTGPPRTQDEVKSAEAEAEAFRARQAPRVNTDVQYGGYS